MERIILDVTYLAELRTTETGIRPKDKFGSDVFHRGFLMFLRLMETQSKTSDRSNSRQTQVYSEVENKQFEIIVARIFSKLDLGLIGIVSDCFCHFELLVAWNQNLIYFVYSFLVLASLK